MSDRCGANTPKRGGTCGKAAGWGTDHVGIGHCKLHGGATPTQRKAAGREIARLECIALGVPVSTDPGQALLDELAIARGNEIYYADAVSRLDRLYGPIMHSSGEPTGEARRHILVQLLDEERDRVARLAVAILKAGVEERRVRLAESLAEQIARFARGLMSEFGIDPASEQARSAYRKHLTLIAGGAA